MCGIAAIIGKNKQEATDLKKMLLPILHRGEKKYFNESLDLGKCVLGMNRLAIVDREKAIQPIKSNNGKFYIVYNGEIYNYKDLQKELIYKGYKFSTNSDTEVLVNGYQEWGEKLLDKISGMFAFFIYDKQTNSFFAARDPIGVKPLYWAKDDQDNYYFASEIKSLVILKQIEKVNLFPPAHFMKNGNIMRYWNMPQVAEEYPSEAEAARTIKELFERAVQIRVQTDLPIGVYLSGGIDSTSVIAMARKFHPDVTAIIMGNDSSEDKEIALRYCKEFGVNYSLVTPPKETAIIEKDIPRTIEVTESFEPNMIRPSTLSRYLAKGAKDAGLKIILCGEGSDELFAGYPEFSTLPGPQEVDDACRAFLNDLHRTQLQRVDRTSMEVTTEVREPFLDKELVEYVMKLPAHFKIKKDGNETITKYILRIATTSELPDYIVNRKKVVLNEGAGYSGNQKTSFFADKIAERVSDKEFNQYLNDYKDWSLETKEEVYYFKLFKSFGYDKAVFNKVRTVVNKTATLQNDIKFAQKILESFDTWKFKREQPKTEGKMREAILHAVRSKNPIQFVMYWGKDERSVAGEKERRAISYLKQMLDTIHKKYPPGAILTFILNDTHAELNGYTKSQIDHYFDSIVKQAKQGDFETTRLSTLAAFNEQILMKKKDDVKIPDALLKLLVVTSKKHCKRYDPDTGAKLYYLQNQIEKKEIEQNYPNSIFLTYNGSELDKILPLKLPIFYMYSIKEGRSIKPWFDD